MAVFLSVEHRYWLVYLLDNSEKPPYMELLWTSLMRRCYVKVKLAEANCVVYIKAQTAQHGSVVGSVGDSWQ